MIDVFYGNVKDQGIPKPVLWKTIDSTRRHRHTKNEEGHRKGNNSVFGFHEIGSRLGRIARERRFYGILFSE